MPSKKIIPPGTRFTRCVVLKEGQYRYGESRSVVRCDCGKVFETSNRWLFSGRTKSCGCLRVDRLRAFTRTHGASTTNNPTYEIWRDMKTRCRDHPRYAGRGIVVCNRWSKFENFLDDMGERPAGMELDRKNNNGNYCPENCRWATRKQQCRNTSRNRVFTINGVTACVAELCERFGIRESFIRTRLKRGWTLERAFSEPRRMKHVSMKWNKHVNNPPLQVVREQPIAGL